MKCWNLTAGSYRFYVAASVGKAPTPRKMAEEKDIFARAQKERWAKYGANVALTIVVVIVLAGLIVYLAQPGHIFNARHTALPGSSRRPST